MGKLNSKPVFKGNLKRVSNIALLIADEAKSRLRIADEMALTVVNEWGEVSQGLLSRVQQLKIEASALSDVARTIEGIIEESGQKVA